MAFTSEIRMPVRDTLKSVKYEGMKLFRTFDSQNRLVTQFEAPTNAKDGDACLRTDYGYDGTSNRIIKLKESQTTWSAVWDL
jgi:hypothetical protein